MWKLTVSASGKGHYGSWDVTAIVEDADYQIPISRSEIEAAALRRLTWLIEADVKRTFRSIEDAFPGSWIETSWEPFEWPPIVEENM